ncbi:MAG: hypothetical protein JRF31_07705 [Deltaproteobacteria bacterium]|nr:hypothetical protein [Deltaproteobacteria bacterium]
MTKKLTYKELEQRVKRLEKEITARKQSEKELLKSEQELNTRNRILEIFLTTTDNKMYGKILEVVLEAVQSPFGTFAYINEDGERVVPSMAGDIWDKCKFPGKVSCFPRETLGNNLWARCIIEKKTISSNGPFKVPDGHIPIFRALTIAEHIAPILHGRLASESHQKEREFIQEQLKTSLKEKDMLLREIHHRFKNNMQVVSSLLSLQSMNIKDRKYAGMFKESLNRIRSMAFIHENLYQSEDFTKINFIKYVNSLVNSIIQSYTVDTKKIKVKQEIEDIQIDLDKAVPCGLLINELVSNALKHAFLNKRVGQIEIGLFSINENETELLVGDDGIGLPEDLDITHTESMGLNLVKILALDQLKGRIEIDREGGTKIHIRFKN